MRHVTGVLCLSLVLIVQASAQMGMGGAGGMGMGVGPRMPRVFGETLMMMRIDGWVPASATTTDSKVDVFMFPEGEDDTNWTEAFQQEAYNSTAGMESARQIYDLRSGGDRQHCANYTSEIRDEEPQNGYSSIVWRQSCEPDPGQTFASLHKVILGNDRMYILSKIWKEQPSDRLWRRWENLFEEIYVCDPTRSEHACRAR